MGIVSAGQRNTSQEEAAMEFLRDEKEMNPFAWAPKSADLSQIEHMWPIVKRAIRGRTSTNQEEIFLVLQDA
jgi:hypothetical protein